MVQSDFALARRLLAGDESAFDEFFAGYFPRLYRFARARLGGNEDAAEEVVQATLIKAINKLHTYRGEAALLTWLCTFCRREIAAWLERAGKTVEVSLLDQPETRAVLDAIAALSGDNPERELHRRELSRLVQAVLDQLPARYGDALEWKYIEGLPVREIAQRLGLGYKAAESLLTRARQAFREGFGLVEG
jgi:RNA polymerase sigma-70 factor (ECF subfamily)